MFTAICTPIPYHQEIFRPLYGDGYGGIRHRIGPVSIRPYTVYGTMLSPNPGRLQGEVWLGS